MGFNKKVLSKAVSELGKAKAPAKPKDIITDPAGQWKYPGQKTRIPGNDITMQGVPYPVWAQPNVGKGSMMQPNQDYNFPGASYVDETPMAKKGGSKLGTINLNPNPLSHYELNYGFNLPAKENGGEADYEDLDLTDEEIQAYKDAGYEIEELPEAQVGTEINSKPYYNFSNDEATSYNPVTQTVNINEETLTPPEDFNGDLKRFIDDEYRAQDAHENFHHYQNQIGTNRIETGRPDAKPTLPSNQNFEGEHYHNRRQIEEKQKADEWRKAHPNESPFINPDILYNKYTDEAMYQDPSTLEGEARAYEEKVRRGDRNFNIVNPGLSNPWKKQVGGPQNTAGPRNEVEPEAIPVGTEMSPDYDLRRFYTEDPMAAETFMAGKGHATDKYKLPNHPTFSNQSMYNSTDTPGGEWIENEDGAWSFNASQVNRSNMSNKDLKSYFDEVEPGNTLNYNPIKKQGGFVQHELVKAQTGGTRKPLEITDTKEYKRRNDLYTDSLSSYNNYLNRKKVFENIKPNQFKTGDTMIAFTNDLKKKYPVNKSLVLKTKPVKKELIYQDGKGYLSLHAFKKPVQPVKFVPKSKPVTKKPVNKKLVNKKPIQPVQPIEEVTSLKNIPYQEFKRPEQKIIPAAPYKKPIRYRDWNPTGYHGENIEMPEGYTQQDVEKEIRRRQSAEYDKRALEYQEQEKAKITKRLKPVGLTENFKEGGSSEQKIIFSPEEGGCPVGQYWTGTECKIIPKNTKIVYSQDELNKSNVSKKEQQKLYNQYISRINNHAAIDAGREKVYGNKGSKDKYYKTFESIPKSGFDPMMSYGTGQLIPNGLAIGVPALNESMVNFSTWKKMMDKSSIKPIGFKGNPGGGHFYPVYEKPSNYLLGYNKENVTINTDIVPEDEVTPLKNIPYQQSIKPEYEIIPATPYVKPVNYAGPRHGTWSDGSKGQFPQGLNTSDWERKTKEYQQQQRGAQPIVTRKQGGTLESYQKKGQVQSSYYNNLVNKRGAGKVLSNYKTINKPELTRAQIDAANKKVAIAKKQQADAQAKAEAERIAAWYANEKKKRYDEAGLHDKYIENATVSDNTRVNPTALAPIAQQAKRENVEIKRKEDQVFDTQKKVLEKGFKNVYDYQKDPMGAQWDLALAQEAAWEKSGAERPMISTGEMGTNKGPKNMVLGYDPKTKKYNTDTGVYDPATRTWAPNPTYYQGSGAIQSVDEVWAAPIALPAVLEGIGAISAMSLPGMAAVPGATVGNLVNAGFIANSMYKTPQNVKDWYDVAQGEKNWKDVAGETGEIALGYLGVPGVTEKIVQGANTAKKLVNTTGEAIAENLTNKVYDLANAKGVNNAKSIENFQFTKPVAKADQPFGFSSDLTPFVGAENTNLALNAASKIEKPSWILFEPTTNSLQIKSTMKGSPLEKQLSKTGEINVNNIKTHIAKADVGQQDKFILDKVLNEKFAGKTKIDYNEFRKAVSEELVPLEKNTTGEYADYGVDRLKLSGLEDSKKIDDQIKEIEDAYFKIYNTPITQDYDMNYTAAVPETILGPSVSKTFPTKEEAVNWLWKNNGEEQGILRKLADIRSKSVENLHKERLKSGILDNKTILYENKNKLGKGDTKHFGEEGTLGHARILVTKQEPDIVHVLEQQSDFYQKQGQGKTLLEKIKGDKSNLILLKEQERINKINIKIQEDEKLLNDLIYKKQNNILHNGYPVQDWELATLDQGIDIAKEDLKLREGNLKNWEQKSFLGKNIQERLLQENVKHAAEAGKSKMRYPTPETAATIQGYTKKVVGATENWGGPMSNQGSVLTDYSPEHQTILKKYEDAPKMIKKVLGVKVKTVTDAKGNTWYEFDIPETAKKGAFETKAFKENATSIPGSKIPKRKPKSKVKNWLGDSDKESMAVLASIIGEDELAADIMANKFSKEIPSVDTKKVLEDIKQLHKEFWGTEEGRRRIQKLLTEMKSPVTVDEYIAHMEDVNLINNNDVREVRKGLIEVQEKYREKMFLLHQQKKAVKDELHKITSGQSNANVGEVLQRHNNIQDAIRDLERKRDDIAEQIINVPDAPKSNAFYQRHSHQIQLGENYSFPSNAEDAMVHEFGHSKSVPENLSRLPGTENKMNKRLIDGTDLYKETPEHLFIDTKDYYKTINAETYNPQNIENSFRPDNYFNKSKGYFLNAQGKGTFNDEPVAFLNEIRADLLRNGYIKKMGDPITEEMISNAAKRYRNIKGHKVSIRLYDIAELTKKTLKTWKDELNNLNSLAIPITVGLGAVGAGALKQEKNGGAIESWEDELDDNEIKLLEKGGYIVERIK